MHDDPQPRRDDRDRGPGAAAAGSDLADLLPIGVAVVTAAGMVRYANPAVDSVLRTEAGHRSACFVDRVPASHGRRVATSIAAVAADVQAASTLVIDLGDHMLEFHFTRPGTAGPGQEPLVLVTVLDLSHRLDRERELQHRANHDPLTGLANRSWMLDHLHERLDRGEALVVAFVDLDRFKTVNDELGHDAGDAVLAAVASGLRGCLYDGEVAARVGGDEFVVVSADLDDDQLADFDQRIRLAVAVVPAARVQNVGASVGVCRSNADDEPWSLLRRADEAMYGHKRRVDRRRTRRMDERTDIST